MAGLGCKQIAFPEQSTFRLPSSVAVPAASHSTGNVERGHGAPPFPHIQNHNSPFPTLHTSGGCYSHDIAETHLDAVPYNGRRAVFGRRHPPAESPSAHNQRTRVMAPMKHFPARTFNALRLSRGMIGPSLELRIAKTKLNRVGPLGNDRGPISRDAWTPKRLSCLVWQMREEGCNTSETRDAKP